MAKGKFYNYSFGILSCFGIIFMVMGHTECKFFELDGWFPYYSFHMPLFIFISGYFFSPKDTLDVIRTGWIDWNVKRNRLESVAEHIYSTQMLAIAMKSEYGYDILIRLSKIRQKRTLIIEQQPSLKIQINFQSEHC